MGGTRSKHTISVTVLRRAYKSSKRTFPESQTQQSKDIHLNIPNKGRPPAPNADKEEIVGKAVLYYANNNTSLTRQGIRDLVQDFVSTLPSEGQNKIAFLDNRPSNNWVLPF